MIIKKKIYLTLPYDSFLLNRELCEELNHGSISVEKGATVNIECPVELDSNEPGNLRLISLITLMSRGYCVGIGE